MLSTNKTNKKRQLQLHHNNLLDQLVQLWDRLQYKILRFMIRFIDGVVVDWVWNNHFVMEDIKEQHLNRINLLLRNQLRILSCVDVNWRPINRFVMESRVSVRVMCDLFSGFCIFGYFFVFELNEYFKWINYWLCLWINERRKSGLKIELKY